MGLPVSGISRVWKYVEFCLSISIVVGSTLISTLAICLPTRCFDAGIGVCILGALVDIILVEPS